MIESKLVVALVQLSFKIHGSTCYNSVSQNGSQLTHVSSGIYIEKIIL